MTGIVNNIVPGLIETIQGGNNGQDVQRSQNDPSFGEVLKSSIEDSVEVLEAGEAAQARAVTGEANLQEVVGAITQAELTLETVVAVRDRLVSAYQELMRMQV